MSSFGPIAEERTCDSFNCLRYKGLQRIKSSVPGVTVHLWLCPKHAQQHREAVESMPDRKMLYENEALRENLHDIIDTYVRPVGDFSINMAAHEHVDMLMQSIHDLTRDRPFVIEFQSAEELEEMLRAKSRLADYSSALSKALDVAVSGWHRMPTHVNLAAWLGLSEDEYSQFAEDGAEGYVDAIIARGAEDE